jgi:uncharacterized protein YjbI with pentapeptide repeats
MKQEEIAAVLAAHKLWLENKGGERANLDGARLDGANLDGANLVGARLVGARLVGANLARANLAHARLVGANLDGANLAHANLAHARLVGANLDGAKINNDKTAIGILRRATRSDGWEFFLWHCQEGFFIKAGCRFFTLEEGRKHWKATRAGTSLGDETQDILAMFAKAIKRVGVKL